MYVSYSTSLYPLTKNNTGIATYVATVYISSQAAKILLWNEASSPVHQSSPLVQSSPQVHAVR